MKSKWTYLLCGGTCIVLAFFVLTGLFASPDSPVANPADKQSTASNTVDSAQKANAIEDVAHALDENPQEASYIDELPAQGALDNANLRSYEPSAKVAERPTKQDIMNERRQRFIDAGQYEQLERFDAKLEYEEKRSKLRKEKHDRLREIRNENRELKEQLSQTDDPEQKLALREQIKMNKKLRKEARNKPALRAGELKGEE